MNLFQILTLTAFADVNTPYYEHFGNLRQVPDHDATALCMQFLSKTVRTLYTQEV